MERMTYSSFKYDNREVIYENQWDIIGMTSKYFSLSRRSN